MMTLTRSLLLWLVPALTLACNDSSLLKIEHEGDDPGECSDGADQDRDELFDCEDDGCADAPECSDDTGGSGGSGSALATLPSAAFVDTPSSSSAWRISSVSANVTSR